MSNKLCNIPWIVAATLGALSLISTSRAAAQTGFLPHVRVKAGVFLPSGGALKSSSSDTWYKVGADVNIPIPLVGSTRIGIDYEASGSSRMVPITVTQIFQPSAVVVKSPIYFGTGIGLWNTHINGGGDATRLGFRVLAGLEFKGLFVEANYEAVGRVSGATADGMSIVVGKKF